MLPIAPRSYQRIVRASAVYDLVVTAPFATPWTLLLVHAGLGRLAAALGVAGLPPLDATHVLLANLLGIVVSTWAVVRLRGPAALGRYDAGARLGFALAQGWALAHGASPVIGGFLVVEVLFFVLQALPVRRADQGLSH